MTTAAKGNGSVSTASKVVTGEQCCSSVGSLASKMDTLNTLLEHCIKDKCLLFSDLLKIYNLNEYIWTLYEVAISVLATSSF